MTQRSGNKALMLLREHCVWLLLAAVALVVIALIWTIWSCELVLYEQLDVTLKIIGGFLAAAAIHNAFQRTRSAEKGQYSDRFAKAVEQIASEKLAIRLGGLASIEALSKETEDEFIRVWTYLGEFLRYPPKLAPWRNEPKAGETKEEQKEPLGQRPDIATVAAMLHDGRNKTHLRWMEENRLSLSDAKLQSARLINANLQGAELFHAKLQNAQLINANLQGANLQDAELQGAELFHTKLQNAQLINANLQGADLFFANLQNADLRNAKLQNADLLHVNLQGANLLGVSLHKRGIQQLFSKDSEGLLKDAFFSLDVLKEALRIKVSMPEKMSEVYYDDSDGPLPNDWPGDYKPQPITYTEWLAKRK